MFIVISISSLCDTLCYFAFCECLVSSYHENVSDSLFHRNCDDVALVLFLDDLIEFLYVHTVKFSFYHGYRHWWSNMHGLLLTKTEVAIFLRVFTTDTDSVVL